MPNFATARLETFLEPRARHSLKKPNSKENRGDPTRRNGGSKHLYISPALYATPEQSPIPDSPSPGPISPSPYIANQKRRRGKIDVGRAEIGELASGNDGDELNLEEAVRADIGNGNLDGNCGDDDEEGFFYPRSEIVSMGSEFEANDLAVESELESRSLVSAQGDYFDAIDDFSSDSSNSNVPSQSSRVESELNAIKLNMVDEVERRKAAEETLMLMRSQWKRISNLMFKAGITFPEPPASGDMEIENDSIAQLSQEVLVGRFVAEAIGRGLAHAEAEEAASIVIESKDQELLRLKDRLQYYETVNHELSQRKLVEVAERQQQRRLQRRWLWSLAGLSIAVGVSFVAFSCIPYTGRFLPPPASSDPTDAYCDGNSDAP